VPGWEELTLQQKTLAYYLYEAALAGRDIIYDQLGKHNLEVRKTIEAIYSHYTGSKSGEEWKAFETYAGRVWFSNGIHHHYASDKILPEFTEAYFSDLIQNTDASLLPLQEGETKEDLLKRLKPVLFDKNYHAKKVNLKDGIDNIVGSANNFYEGVTQKEVEAFYATFPNSDHEPEWGLNSKLVKENGKLVEKVWKVGGMYDGAISKIVYWLNKAITVAENEAQAKALRLLVEYYQTGDVKKWDEYNIAWVADTASRIDVVNGFVEVYDDAIGKKGSYESVVSLKDMESTKRIAAIAAQAQWFEDNAPLIESHKKKEVKGISAKAITVIVEGGAATPVSYTHLTLPTKRIV
jgi:dipeptidyl-peptidase-3